MLNVKRVASVAILLLIVGFTGAFLTYESFADGDSIEEEKTFDEQITAVTVETDNSAIEIVPADDQVSRVEFEGGTSGKSHYHFDAEVKNGKLHVKVKEKILQFFNFDFSFDSIVTRVYLPEKEYESLIAETGNGKVRIENISAETISAESVNGEVALEDVHTQVAQLQSVNGKISADYVEGAVEAEVTNGTIHLRTLSLVQPLTLESVNGKINVQVDEKPINAEINVEAVNGRLDIFGKNSNYTVFGDGAAKINIKTVNGNITVGH